jgi:hypothetical protein
VGRELLQLGPSANESGGVLELDLLHPLNVYGAVELLLQLLLFSHFLKRLKG